MPDDAGPALQRESTLSAAESNRQVLDRLKPRWQRSRKDESKYFAVKTECLGCGADCQVKIDDLHSMLRCRNCGTVMHMNHTGNWEIGIPKSLLKEEQTKKVETSDANRQSHDKAATKNGFVGWIAQNRIFAGAVLAGTVVVAVITLLLARSNSDSVPDTLRGRATTVAKAVLEGDARSLKGIADPRSASDADQWFAFLTKKLDAEQKRFPNRPLMQVKMLSENKDKGTGAVSVTFVFTARSAKAAAGESPHQVSIESIQYWYHDGKQWLLDGKKTLSNKD